MQRQAQTTLFAHYLSALAIVSWVAAGLLPSRVRAADAGAVATAEGGVCSAVSEKRCLCGAVNINAATEVELMLLPRIGEKKANAILEARAVRRGFTHIHQLMRVRGIGRKTMRMLRPHLKLNGPSTLHETQGCSKSTGGEPRE